MASESSAEIADVDIDARLNAAHLLHGTASGDRMRDQVARALQQLECIVCQEPDIGPIVCFPPCVDCKRVVRRRPPGPSSSISSSMSSEYIEPVSVRACLPCVRQYMQQQVDRCRRQQGVRHILCDRMYPLREMSMASDDASARPYRPDTLAMWAMDRAGLRPPPCADCGRVFATRRELYMHVDPEGLRLAHR